MGESDSTDFEDDKQIVERCLDGHSDEFRHLVGRYQRPVLAFLALRLRDQTQVEDAAQESFVRAFLKLKTLRTRDAFFPWLLGIAENVVHERIREKFRDQRYLEEWGGRPPDPSLKPPGQGEAALEQAIAALTDPLRQVILLRFYGECSCAQVARRLGLPVGTVTKRLSRAYGEIRERLAATGLQH